MTKFPTLYKRSSTGALLEWSIKVDGDHYWSTHGQVGGKLIIDTPTVAETKNAGRSNEVLPPEQAKLEAERKWKNQLDNGYCEDKKMVDDESVTAAFFKPTLAVEWKDSTAKHLPEKAFISPKLDGLRCVISKDGAFTRNGKRYVTSKFIEEALVPFFEANPTVTLDGELYNHILKDDFNKITSLARKTKAESVKEKDWEAIRNILQLHVFDCRDSKNPDAAFELRLAWLNTWNLPECCVVVPQTLIERDKLTIHRRHDEFTEDGYEGAMLRDPSLPYKFGRIKGLQKVKIFKDDEFEIVDFTPGKGKMAEIAARVVVRMPNGETSDAGLNYKHDECREFLENKENYIGKMATVKYFNLTPDGKLRFGKMIDIDRPDL